MYTIPRLMSMENEAGVGLNFEGREGRRGWLRWLAAVIGVASCLLLGACGSSTSSSSASGTAEATEYVTAEDLSQYGADSPQRTALEWWKAVQFANAGLARSYYATRARPTLAELQRELAIAARQFVGVPRFESTEVDGDVATLYFFAVRQGSEATPQALSVNLVKAHGRWLLADDQLLEQEVARAERAAQSRGE